MRRTIIATLAIGALVCVAVVATGCDLFHDYNKDANALIGQVNASLGRYQSLDATVQALAVELESISVDPKGAKKALATTAKIRQTLDAQKSELETATATLEKLKKIKVSDEMKKYADLEIAAIAAQMKVVDEGKALYDEMDQIYKAVRDKTGTTRKVDASTARIQEIRTQIGTLVDQGAQAEQAAQDYFEKNVVGK